MSLPAGGLKVPWPPLKYQMLYRRMAEHAAWYSGDTERLAAVYGGSVALEPYFGAPPLSTMDRDRSRPWWQRFRFWSKRNTALPSTRLRIHVPLASDLAMTSADLLFSDPPQLQIPGAVVASPKPADVKAQARLGQLVELDQIVQTLLEAGETSAALGGVYLRVVWDTDDFPDRPLLTIVQADCAVPDFRWGELVAVTFWRKIQVEPDSSGSSVTGVYRHLERHERGVIIHGLYKGDLYNLGTQVPLRALPDTALLASGDELTGTIDTGMPDRLTAVYIPNVRPHREHPEMDQGRSDYAASEGFMDALDETYTSWMRDLRLARARIIVPEDYVRDLTRTDSGGQGRGKGAIFDIEQEVFHPIPGLPPMEGGITMNQFAIRVKEHSDTARALIERIVSTAGYAYSTFGLPEAAVAVTATEIAARERRSLVTRGKKLKYWQRPLAEILETLLLVDYNIFKGPKPARPKPIFSQGVPVDPEPMARTIHLLAQAEALSTDTKVRMLHPDWTDDQVAKEVTDILGLPRPPGSPPVVILPFQDKNTPQTGAPPNGVPDDPAAGDLIGANADAGGIPTS